jgi:hypothetical protein
VGAPCGSGETTHRGESRSKSDTAGSHFSKTYQRNPTAKRRATSNAAREAVLFSFYEPIQQHPKWPNNRYHVNGDREPELGAPSVRQVTQRPQMQHVGAPAMTPSQNATRWVAILGLLIVVVHQISNPTHREQVLQPGRALFGATSLRKTQKSCQRSVVVVRNDSRSAAERYS